MERFILVWRCNPVLQLSPNGHIRLGDYEGKLKYWKSQIPHFIDFIRGRIVVVTNLPQFDGLIRKWDKLHKELQKTQEIFCLSRNCAPLCNMHCELSSCNWTYENKIIVDIQIILFCYLNISMFTILAAMIEIGADVKSDNLVNVSPLQPSCPCTWSGKHGKQEYLIKIVCSFLNCLWSVEFNK